MKIDDILNKLKESIEIVAEEICGKDKLAKEAKLDELRYFEKGGGKAKLSKQERGRTV